MTANGILQIIVFTLVLTLLAKPMGVYLTKVYAGERTFLSFLFKPIEQLFYAVTRVDATREMNWKQYGVAMLIFSLVSSVALFAIQRLQFYLPFNPQEFAGPSSDSSFNTAVSFVTNTNWQGYVPLCSAERYHASYFWPVGTLALADIAEGVGNKPFSKRGQRRGCSRDTA